MISDLPAELHIQILSHLNFRDQMNAVTVFPQWSTLLTPGLLSEDRYFDYWSKIKAPRWSYLPGLHSLIDDMDTEFKYSLMCTISRGGESASEISKSRKMYYKVGRIDKECPRDKYFSYLDVTEYPLLNDRLINPALSDADHIKRFKSTFYLRIASNLSGEWTEDIITTGEGGLERSVETITLREIMNIVIAKVVEKGLPVEKVKIELSYTSYHGKREDMLQWRGITALASEISSDIPLVPRTLVPAVDPPCTIV